MRRLSLSSFFAMAAALSSSPVWALDASACLNSVMKWSGAAFVLAAPSIDKKPSQEYRKRLLTPTSVCRGIGVQTVELGTQGQNVLYAQLKWKASPNLPVLESLPVGIQGAISAQIRRESNIPASHAFEWREFSRTSFMYNLNRQSGQYQETVTWGAEMKPNEYQGILTWGVEAKPNE